MAVDSRPESTWRLDHSSCFLAMFIRAIIGTPRRSIRRVWGRLPGAFPTSEIRCFEMRTTLAIDDDVLAPAKELAATERKSVGEVISALARLALRPAETGRKVRNGVPLLPVNPGTQRVTSELVHWLREELL